MAQNSEDAPTSAKHPMIIKTKASASTAETKEELVKMFCMHLRSSDILDDLEDKSFLEFLKNLLKHTLPSKKTFTEELIPEVFNKARSDLMKTLASVHHVSISIEMWKWGETDESNMLTATVHFVHQSKFVSQTLFTVGIQEWTKENIGKAVEDRLTEWHVLKKVVRLIASCGTHGELLKDVAANLLNITYAAGVASILNSFIEYSLDHINFVELETKCQNGKAGPVLKTKKDEPFCWHDQYIVLKHISEDNAGNFTAKEREAYSECFEMLKFVDDLNNKLTSQRYITRSCIFPLFLGLKLKINKGVKTDIIARICKNKLEQRIAILKPKTTFMDPRFKTTVLKYYSTYKDLLTELEAELDDYINQQNPVRSTSNNQSEENVNVLDYLKDKREKMTDASTRAKAMMAHYVSVPGIPIDANPFQFWEDFTRLYKYNEFYMMALKYLCIPANEIPIETISGNCPWKLLFSNNTTYNERRELLEYENIDKILFLHSYYSNTTFEDLF